MASTTNKLLTLVDLENIPEQDGFRYELRNGEIIEMPPPDSDHYEIQHRLMRLLMAAAGAKALVGMEFGFAIPENNYRIADVIFLAAERWRARARRKLFEGAPDLAIELLSPSNTDSEMREKRQLCVANGSREFWVIDPGARVVEVYTLDGRWTVYNPAG